MNDPALSPDRNATHKRDAAIIAGVLLVAYVATLAPGPTLWDSGEFLSAVATLGVPHPPGTPLFVALGRVWSDALGFLPLAVAMNLASAIATAVACGALAAVFLRRAGTRGMVAGGVVAGTMAAVWQSATETEVYAFALCLAALYLLAADGAGRRGSTRHRLLVAFLFGLAVSLQISALVAGPAAVMLLSTDADGRWVWRQALAPAGAWVAAVGIGTASVGLAVAGAAMMLVAPTIVAHAGGFRKSEGLGAGLVLVLGASFVLVMLVRAQHDPALNHGNPSTWERLWAVIGRQQYDVPGLWPRRAPWWLQIGNLIQYADWQVASSLSDAPGASLARTPFTILAALAAGYGAAWHRRLDIRSFRAMVCALLCATLGVIAVLNLRAGPSYGWGILPDGALREARERDYFFALAFALWGLWAGLGVARLALGARGAMGRRLITAAAALPLLLNWAAADRRRLPDARLAESLGMAMLQAAPPNAVLMTAGDNDSYATWYAQHVLKRRPDVTTVVTPMLGAGWYRDELQRRHSLLGAAVARTWQGELPTLRAIAERSELLGRPLVVSAGLDKGQRTALRSFWRFTGITYQVRSGAPTGAPVVIDSATARGLIDSLNVRGLGLESAPARGSAGGYIQRLLQCPHAAIEAPTARRSELVGLLESTCNY